MNYKSSKFNIKVDDNRVYNTWHCKYVETEYVEELCNPDYTWVTPLSELKKERFIVPEMLDETSTMLKEKAKYRSNPNPNLITLEICTTMLCNMSCIYCFEKTAHKQHMSKETEKDLVSYIKRVVENNGNLKKLRTIWFGGEPLLKVDTIERVSEEIIPYLQTKGIDYGALVLTNGLLLTEEVSVMLQEKCKVENVQVTIDGFKDTYARVKQVPLDTYDKVLRNIETAKQKVYVRLNFTKKNAEELFELEKYLKNRYGNHIVIAAKKVRAFDEETKEIELSWEEFVPYRNRYIEECEDSCVYKETAEAKHYGCEFCQHSNVIIDATGLVYRCDAHMGHKEKAIGNLVQGIDENNTIHKSFMEMELEGECRECNIAPYCLGGCYEKYQQGERPCSMYRYALEQSLKT